VLDEDPELRDPRNAPIAGELAERLKSQAVWGRIS
jgi:hypothetical protein